MRTPMIWAALVAVVVATGCSSSSPRPAAVRNYGPEVGSFQAPAPRASAPVAPAPLRASAGRFTWHARLADAQAEARASGRMILCLATKPNCGLCDKFKTQILPPMAHRVQPLAVGYVYDITRPERRELDRALRSNLTGADLMPLVGFFTPDLGFVHGFWGARTQDQFRGDLATASRMYPVSRAALGEAGGDRPRMAMVTARPIVNEFGETEWGLPGDVWPGRDPEPIDAITGSPELPAAPPAAPAALAAATPPRPAVPVTVASLPPAPPPPPAWRPDGRAAPASISGTPPPPPPPADGLVAIQTPEPFEAMPPRAPILVVDGPAPRTADQTLDGAAWARDALERALSHIRGGRYDAAREVLTQVEQRRPTSDAAREAARGRVALYNAKRIRTAASESERARYLSRARRDLGQSMWIVLFQPS